MVYAVVGAGLGVLVIIGAVTFYCRRVRKNAKQNEAGNSGPVGAISRFDAHSGQRKGSLSECEVTGRGLTRQPTLDEYGLPGPSEPVYDSEPTTNDASSYEKH